MENLPKKEKIMALFNFGKKKEEVDDQMPKDPGNPTTMILFRALAIGYVIWILKDLVAAYIAGGEEAPSLPMLIGAIVVLGAGCVVVGIMSYNQWKKMKEAQKIYNEEVARMVAEEERLEAEKKALEAEFPEDGEYHEEEDFLEETEETAEETE